MIRAAWCYGLRRPKQRHESQPPCTRSTPSAACGIAHAPGPRRAQCERRGRDRPASTEGTCVEQLDILRARSTIWSPVRTRPGCAARSSSWSDTMRASSTRPKPFVPGESAVQVAGKVYGEPEMRSLVDSALDFWLTTGRFNDEFEKKLASAHRRAPRAHHQFGIVGQPSGLFVADLAVPAGPRAEARRRDDHGCDRLPDDRQPGAAIWHRAGVRRHRHPDLQHQAGHDRGGRHRAGRARSWWRTRSATRSISAR